MNTSSLPAALDQLAADPRITVRNTAPLPAASRAVVYWMQRAQRAVDNPALDVAIRVANYLGLPVVVYFHVIPNYPNANLRHYHFLQQGLVDVAADCARRGIGFVVRRPPQRMEAFLAEVDAALLVGDENPCRGPEHWRQHLAASLTIPFWTVDADVVVPSALFGRTYFLLHHFRPHLKHQLPAFLVAAEAVEPVSPWQPEKPLDSYDLQRDITADFADLDRTIAPVDTFVGGSRAALARLQSFTGQLLANYNTTRNQPEVDGTSRLSPYLHFGHISPITIALAVRSAAQADNSLAAVAEKFLDELIGWRELAVLFVRHCPTYDTWESAEPWARKTLEAHAADPRPFLYTLDQLERAQTHDELWNAAQQQMVVTGWMHNYMRMYWAKKILEWSPTPQEAFARAVTLNDRYQLDGRDPNGYAGIAWAIVGRHDRPWFDKPVIGVVRPMSGAALYKKFDARRYVRQHLASPSLF